ncbi:zinc finger BED domain-containing protein RICESLEEPER 2-like isoform X2 [Macadamia integrifolia]|nr:zinc finger BED domain-containing protein RICESLEEPER 2-like isoform X2 [Macadamia integrifolia]XP_042499570.1 zinc finger BED domain-containing protein RICESLEEPER 2-like isoform X2 [Macadamia integrifolia]XP_042499571.1 zinc finger BED domain-containing protein RICESLEEPER 2-like isoform X2 [Macadamia integrifolia]
MPINIEDEPDCGSDADVMSDDGPYIPGIPSTEPSSVVRLETNATTKRKRRSVVWDEFTIIDGQGFDDGKNRAECKRCKQVYRADSNINGTGSLRRHILHCPKRENKGNTSTQMILGVNDGKVMLRDQKVDQDFVRDKITKLIVRHELPLVFVEYEEFRELITYLFPGYTHIARNTQMSDILRLYNLESIRIRNLLNSFPGRISLTSDLWTSITNDGYIALTSHYIDKDWVLHKKLLKFCIMPPPHTGIHICEMVSKILSDWGIDRKLFSITLDNATANFCFVDLLKKNLNLKNALLCRGLHFHNRCCAHILNLIVQDGLKHIDDSVVLVRSSIAYVKGSHARKVKFLEICKQLRLQSSKGLRADVSTRWNSTYLMLDSALFYCKAFENLGLVDDNFKTCPSSEQWLKIERLTSFLYPFYAITVLLSGSKYPTVNLYFENVWEIHKILLEEVSRGLNFMKPMAVEMKKKFDKYWSEYSPILAIALVFDPRYKLSFVTWAFSKLCNLDLNASTMCHNVRNSLYQLFDEYKSMQPSDYDVPTLTHRPGRSRTRFEFMVSELAEMDNGNKSQLDIYLDEPKVPFNDNEYDEYDVLAFWKANGSRYPDVARMARDVLAIPVSTVASESAFSAGGRVIDKYRSKLLPTNAEALICLRDWMFDIDFRAEPFDDPTDVDNALGNILELLHIENERGAVASSSAGPTPREG